MSTRKPRKTRTQIALDYLTANPKATPCAAAAHAGVAPSVIYRAIAARARPRCPTCGQPIKKP